MIKKGTNAIASICKGSTPIQKIYKGTLVVYEAFKKLIGVPPLTLLKSKGEDLVDYKIYGSTIQEGTPTPEAPIEIQSVGDKTKNILDNSKLLMDTHYKTDGNQGYYEGRIASPKINVSNINTISVKYSRNISTNVAFLSWDKEGNLLERSVTKISSSQTSGVLDVSNCYEIAFFWWGTLAETIEDIYDVMICEGSEILDYEPYGYRIPIKSNDNIVNIYLNEPLRKIGDYIDYIDFELGKIVRNTLKLNLINDGNFYSANKGASTSVQQYNYRLNENKIIANIGLCSDLTYNTSVTGGKDVGFHIISGALIVFGMPKDVLENYGFIDSDEATYDTAFQKYLENSSIEVICVLVTPAEEDIELPNIPTLKGTTILSVDTEIQPSNMEVIYK